MSHSNYKNIYEGYLDNTGYRAHRRESYGGCGSEPTPYMMNEGYKTGEKALPDCGKVESLKRGWTSCTNNKQTAIYGFTLDPKYKAKAGGNANVNLKDVCKIPLPSNINASGVTANFGSVSLWDDNFGVNSPSTSEVIFDNSLCVPYTGKWNENVVCNTVKSNRVDGYALKSFTQQTPQQKNFEYKSPVELQNQNQCRTINTIRWVRDSSGTVCPLSDYVSTNYWKCEKKDGGGDDDHRERCCKSNLTPSGYCNFNISPCKNYVFPRIVPTDAAKNDVGGVKQNFLGVEPDGTDTCTSDIQCRHGCVNGRCST